MRTGKGRYVALVAGVVAGLLLAGSIVLAAVNWKEIAVRFEAYRIVRDPALLSSFIRADPGSVNGQAVRRYFRERPGRLARLLITEVCRWCGLTIDPNISSMRRASFGIGRNSDRTLGAWYIFQWRAGEPLSGASQWSSSGRDDEIHALLDVLESFPSPLSITEEESDLPFRISRVTGRVPEARDEYPVQYAIDYEQPNAP